MNIEEIKNKINNLTDTILYKSIDLGENEEKDLEQIITYFKNNKNTLDDLKFILKDRNNDNYPAYEKVLIEILTKVSKEVKLNILYNSDIYIDILKNRTNR